MIEEKSEANRGCRKKVNGNASLPFGFCLGVVMGCWNHQYRLQSELV